MASKRKSKPKNHEIMFGSKCIDLRRFAYDFIVHSALRFKVPKNCIPIWEGSENDYGCPEFCLVMSRSALKHQIAQRYALHTIFNNRYRLNKLESFKSVGDLFQEVIANLTRVFRVEIIDEVEITLSIACELVLFLYSKNSNLYLKELARFWFDGYCNLVKKKFEKAGGLDSLYKRGIGPKCEHVDAFYDTFISVHCLPYEDSVKDEHLKDLFNESFDKYDKKITRRYSSKEVVGGDSPSAGGIKEYLFEFYVPPLTSELDKVPELDLLIEASGIDLPVNTGLGIVPHEVLLWGADASVAAATPSQNLPGASSQEGARHRTRSSGQQKRPKGKSSLCSSVEQGLGQLRLDSSRTKQSIDKKPSVSVADGPTSSQKLPGASPQELASHRRRSSGQQKRPKGKSSLCSSVEQSLGQLRLGEASGIDLPVNTGLGIIPHEALLRDADATPSQNLPGASPEEPTRHRRLSSGQKKKQR